MEEKKAFVVIRGKEYQVRFTIGFWKKMKEQCSVTKTNFASKLQEDFGTVSAWAIYWGIFYGMPDRIEQKDMPVTVDDIEQFLETKDVLDAVEQATYNGMTNAERQLVDLAHREKQKKIQAIELDIEDGKKK